MKRKEIKWRREGRRVMTGRQDGVIFRIWTPYDAPEKGYSVSSNDTKGRGRGINTADHKTFPTWEAAVEFCQVIMVVEFDLETMRAEFVAAEAEKERRAIRRAVAGHDKKKPPCASIRHRAASQRGESPLGTRSATIPARPASGAARAVIPDSRPAGRAARPGPGPVSHRPGCR